MRPGLRWRNPELSYLLTAVVVLLALLTLGVGMAFHALMGWARSIGSGARPARQLAADPRAGRGRAAGRPVLTLAAGTTWQRIQRVAGQCRLRSSVTAAGAILILAAADRILPAGRSRRRSAHPGPGDRGGAGRLVALSVNTWTPVHPTSAVPLACAAAVLAITCGSRTGRPSRLELARPPMWLLVVFAAAAFSSHLPHRRLVSPRRGSRTAQPAAHRLWP